MAAEESLIHLLDLFDSLWFDNQIPKKKLNPPFVCIVENDNQQPKLARVLTCDHDQDHDHDHDKSTLITTSRESLSSGDSDNLLLSPDSVLMRSPAASKLETILSGKESSESPKEKREEKKVVNSSTEKINATRKRKRRKGKGKGGLSSKSLSELEFEEVKGFMDLGFVFSEGDKNSSLVKIIPGLQRFGQGDKEEEEEEEEEDKNSSHNCLIKRPYLSQAWENMEYKRKEPAADELIKWRINAAVLDNEMDMKHHLRFWAQSVASAVK